MRLILLVAFAAVTRTGDHQTPAAGRPADVALYALTVTDTTNARLRAVGDSCVNLMAQRLIKDTLTVMRRPAPLAQVRRAGTATFAIIGTLAHDSGKYEVELKLWDIAADEELRAYFGGADPDACKLPVAAAVRIAQVLKKDYRDRIHRRP